MKLALEVQHLRKSFGAVSVAKDIELRLEKGARHAVIGPNGAGKTTLVGMLSGLIRPDAGKILLDGVDITNASPDRRTRGGLVRTFQVSTLFSGLTVLENVFLAVSERSGMSLQFWRPAGKRTETLEAAEKIAVQLGLGSIVHRRVSEIAYGQQRLLELAIALALKPRVLLLDEPAAGIPGDQVGMLVEAVRGLPSDIAILIIEHDMQVVRQLATEITVLVAGQVLLRGTPKDVMNSERVRAVYLGAAGTKRFEMAGQDA